MKKISIIISVMLFVSLALNYLLWRVANYPNISATGKPKWIGRTVDVSGYGQDLSDTSYRPNFIVFYGFFVGEDFCNGLAANEMKAHNERTTLLDARNNLDDCQIMAFSSDNKTATLSFRGSLVTITDTQATIQTKDADGTNRTLTLVSRDQAD